ncbi:MAG: phospholipid/cholesterol/gamma-HCH transport system substrate-binding protein [Gammaproteobacteria bacterium]|jgi:phospholipid/cholesterol/gamma-HCH transport system substrate-binding protein
MKRDNVNYVAAGAFVVLTGLGLLVSIYALLGRSASSDGYFVYYPNVSGMKFGTAVLYEGYRVGQVEAIVPEHGPDGTRYKVELSVDEGWPIRRGSTARVASSGLISAITIDIAAGEGPDALVPGVEIVGESRVDMFAALSGAANDFRSLSRDSLRPLAESMNKELTGLMLDVRGLTNDSVRPLIETVSAQLADPALFEDIKSLTKRLNGVSGRLDAFLNASNLDHAADVLAHVSVLSGELVVTNRRVQTLLDDDVERGLDDILGNLQTLSAGLIESNERLQQFIGERNEVLVQRALESVAAAANAIGTQANGIGEMIDATTRERAQGALASLATLVDELRDTNRNAQALLGAENRKHVTGVLAQTNDLVKELRGTNAAAAGFLDDENKAHVKRALGSVDEVASSLREVSATIENVASERNRRHVSQILANVESATRDMGGLMNGLGETRGRLDEVLAELDGLVSSNGEHLSVAARDLRKTLGVLADHVGSFSHHLEGGSRNVHEFTRQIRENPSLLLSATPQSDQRRSNQ